MLARAYSGAVQGIEAYTVEIEANVSGGENFSVSIVGLPDAAVKESKDRVLTAIQNSSYSPSFTHLTVNLAPADVRKEGPSFDLPIAIATLAAEGLVNGDMLGETAMVGELALSGEIRRVRGVLSIALHLRKAGIRNLLVPAGNAEEAAVVEGINVYPVATLTDAVDVLNGTGIQTPHKADLHTLYSNIERSDLDFADVKGQEMAKRAIEISVAGGHNMLMIGPPGSGKSMLAKRIVSILPELALEEALEATKIHSIAGTLPQEQALIIERPYRSPHHTISDAGLLGGGTHPMPGEVSLAHNGVLFLDELPEFRRNVLEVLRQPLEDGAVVISRAAATVRYPCRFMLVGAMNPCPCGYLTDHRRRCRCGRMDVQRYRNKISGPLLDRIDIHIEVPAVSFDDLRSVEDGESSALIRKRIVGARTIQRHRFEGTAQHTNAQMGPRELRRCSGLSPRAEGLLKSAINDMHLSARAYDRILRVSRTIADLADSTDIDALHLQEAIQYRSLDRQLWN